MELHDPEQKVKAILEIWLENMVSIDRRLRLLSKMQKVRKAKISDPKFVRFHQDFVGQLLMSEKAAIAKARATNQWIASGNFGFTNQVRLKDFSTILLQNVNLNQELDLSYPNLLLTCVNPLNSALAEKAYPNQQALEREIINYSTWIYEAEQDDQLIFAPHAIDSPFQV